MGLKIKSTERRIDESLTSLEKKLKNEGVNSKEIEAIRNEMIVMKEEVDKKYSIETERVMRDFSRRMQHMEDLVEKQSQMIKKIQSHPPSTGPQGFQSSAPLLDDYSSDGVRQLEGKVAETDRQLAVLKVNISELELQLQASLASTYNGSFLWRIPDIKRRRRDALEGKITSIYSPPFYTGRNGYKMCVRAYLNGDGIGYNTHLSIFFVLMKGISYQLLSQE